MPPQSVGSDSSFIDKYLAITISEWHAALSELYDWHEKLHHLLAEGNTPALLSASTGFTAHYSWSTQALTQLQQDLLALLTRLEQEMETLDEDMSPNLLIQKLRQHTRIMVHLNRTIHRVFHPPNAASA